MTTPTPKTSGGIKINYIPQRGNVIPEHNQIKIKFPNGYSASIVYGATAYSTNERGERFTAPLGNTEYASSVEIAIYDPQDQTVLFKHGEAVKGYVELTELFQILNWVCTQ